jgi:splicing factor 3A subunit 1
MRPPPSSDQDDEPSAKKAKTEEQLVPENVFLSQHPGPVTFRVLVPNVTDKSEWKLNGQTFSITLPMTDSVSVIKAKVFDVTGMQAGKQKLQLEGMFLKDSNTLAFYNITPMSVVQLQLKERGGRKK